MDPYPRKFPMNLMIPGSNIRAVNQRDRRVNLTLQWRISQPWQLKAGTTEDRLVNVTLKLNIKLKTKKAEIRREDLWYTQQMVNISASIHSKFPSFMKTQ